MTTITTRATKGSTLTYNELDGNFSRNAQAKVANYTVAEGDNNDTIECAGTFTITLPDAAGIVALADTGDFEVTLKCISGTITVARTTGTDTIDGTAANITLLPNEAVTLKVNQAGNGYNVNANALPLLGITSSVAELNILDGVTSTAAELNILDGVTSTAAELNILDGVLATAAEINNIDGSTAATATTIVDADRVILNDAGVMKQVAVTDVDTYISGTTKTLTNKTLTSPVLNGTLSGTAFLDEDAMTSNSAIAVPSQQSVKAYVDNKLVILDTPEQIVTSDATNGSWVTVNSATLASASAKAAIIKIHAYAGTSATALVATRIYIRKTGSGLTPTILTEACRAHDHDTGATHYAEAISTYVVNLDTNQDFDWYALGGFTTSVDIVLVGYYV